jgi:hypothetical protein
MTKPDWYEYEGVVITWLFKDSPLEYHFGGDSLAEVMVQCVTCASELMNAGHTLIEISVKPT